MGIIITFIGGLLAPLVWKLFALIGIGFVSYTGFDLIMQQLLDVVFTHFSGLPSDVLSLIALSQIDVAMNMIFSAYLAAFTLKTTMNSSLFGKV